MLPHAFLRSFPFCALSRWAWCPPCVPRMSSMLDNLRIHKTSMAILLLPLVRVNTLAIWRR